MRVIWKYPLEITDLQCVMMPEHATILSVHEQNGQICLWAEVRAENTPSRRQIEIIGTGNPIEYHAPSKDGWLGGHIERRFIGTVVESRRPLVWHVFERLKP